MKKITLSGIWALLRVLLKRFQSTPKASGTTTLHTYRRVIAFRFWHFERQVLYDVVNIAVEGLVLSRSHSDRSIHLFNISDGVLQQNTGSKDCLGQEVWEGDIIRVDQSWPEEDLRRGETSYSMYQYVAYRYGGFALINVGNDAADPKLSQFNVEYLTEYENHPLWERVRVGNMYETPQYMALTGLQPLHPDHVKHSYQTV